MNFTVTNTELDEIWSVAIIYKSNTFKHNNKCLNSWNLFTYSKLVLITDKNIQTQFQHDSAPLMQMFSTGFLKLSNISVFQTLAKLST